MRNRSLFAVLTCITALTGASAASAHPGGWAGPGWDAPRPAPRALERDRSREGRVQVNRFVGDDVAALGKGAIAVAASRTEGQDYVPQSNRAAYEAAVVDQLVRAGYDTTHPRPDGGQLAELQVTRTVVQDAEARRKPVSGEMAMSVGNRGAAYGLALNVDLSKPLPALVSTKLEARIRDRASGSVLWEGRAEVATREGDKDWGEQEIAARLAEALFDGFPAASDAQAGG